MDRRDIRKSLQPVYDGIWKAYPRHQDYGGGFNAFLDLMEEGVDPGLLLSKAADYSRNVDPNNLQYVPHLKSWLKGRRYEDEDLFTDQRVSIRSFLETAYDKADALAVAERFGFCYGDPPIPNDVVDVAKYCADDRRRWVAAVANHLLHGAELPS